MKKIRHSKIKRNNPPIFFIQLNKKEGDALRKNLIKQYKRVCPILKKKVPESNLVIDHKHKLINQKPGPRGRGLVRGLIDFRANSLEGIILKKYKKSGLISEIDLITFLRNLADYLENPPVPQKYIHWKEKQKLPFLKKSDYNRIVKYYKIMFPRSKKIPPYPPSKVKKVGKNKKKKYVARLTPKWEKLLKIANEIHERNKK